MDFNGNKKMAQYLVNPLPNVYQRLPIALLLVKLQSCGCMNDRKTKVVLFISTSFIRMSIVEYPCGSAYVNNVRVYQLAKVVLI